jgi:hypothetical protein
MLRRLKILVETSSRRFFLWLEPRLLTQCARSSLQRLFHLRRFRGKLVLDTSALHQLPYSRTYLLLAVEIYCPLYSAEGKHLARLHRF